MSLVGAGFLSTARCAAESAGSEFVCLTPGIQSWDVCDDLYFQEVTIYGYFSVSSMLGKLIAHE